MGHQYIKQPNGKFAIWSSIVDDFVYFDCTKEEIIEAEVEEVVERLKADITKTLDKVEKGEPAYYQFTQSWEEALARRDEQHGKDREFDDQGNPAPEKES